MNPLQSSLILGAVVWGLASCSSPQASTPDASTPASSPAATAPKASPSPSAMTTKAPAGAMSAASAGFTALQGVIAHTKTAIEAGNFVQGKTEFDNFETSWKTVEDGVKAKSGETYTAIEDGMDKVTEGLKSKNKADVLAGLQALDKSVAIAAKP